jgi:hypothetical protein
MQGTFGHISSKMKSHLSDKRIYKFMLHLVNHFLVFVDVQLMEFKEMTTPTSPYAFEHKKITFFSRTKVYWDFFKPQSTIMFILYFNMYK